MVAVDKKRKKIKGEQFDRTVAGDKRKKIKGEQDYRAAAMDTKRKIKLYKKTDQQHGIRRERR